MSVQGTSSETSADNAASSGGASGRSASGRSAGGASSTSTRTSAGVTLTAASPAVPAFAQTAGQPSPPLTNTVASSGGSATANHSGGGGETLAACMGFWEVATHMSKAEWRDTCQRTLKRIDLPRDAGKPDTASALSAVKRTRQTRVNRPHAQR